MTATTFKAEGVLQIYHCWVDASPFKGLCAHARATIFLEEFLWIQSGIPLDGERSSPSARPIILAGHSLPACVVSCGGGVLKGNAPIMPGPTLLPSLFS